MPASSTPPRSVAVIVLGVVLGVLAGVGCVMAVKRGGLIAERVALHNQFDYRDFGFGLIRGLFALAIGAVFAGVLMLITPRSVFRIAVIVTGAVCLAHVLLFVWWGTPMDRLVHTPAFESLLSAALFGAMLVVRWHRDGAA